MSTVTRERAMPSPGNASTLFQLQPRLRIIVILIIFLLSFDNIHSTVFTLPYPPPLPLPLGCSWTSPVSWSGFLAVLPRPARSFCFSSHPRILSGPSALQRLCFLCVFFVDWQNVAKGQHAQISTAPWSGARCPARCRYAQNSETSQTLLLCLKFSNPCSWKCVNYFTLSLISVFKFALTPVFSFPVLTWSLWSQKWQDWSGFPNRSSKVQALTHWKALWSVYICLQDRSLSIQ